MTRIIKIGGNEMNISGFLEGLAGQIAVLAMATREPVVIVHGGGQDIASLQTRLGLETVKVDGLRVTNADSLAVAQMVLSGHTNKQVVKALLAAGLDAVGFSGVDGGLLRCRKKHHPTADLGYVGEITGVRGDFLRHFAEQGIIPVISPISLGDDGQTYNVNADEVAGAIAGALSARVLDFVSNVPGVLHAGHVISSLTKSQAEELIRDGIITDGMIPKVRTALDALDSGVPQVRIVNLPGLGAGGGTVLSDVQISDKAGHHIPKNKKSAAFVYNRTAGKTVAPPT